MALRRTDCRSLGGGVESSPTVHRIRPCDERSASFTLCEETCHVPTRRRLLSASAALTAAGLLAAAPLAQAEPTPTAPTPTDGDTGIALLNDLTVLPVQACGVEANIPILADLIDPGDAAGPVNCSQSDDDSEG